MLYFFACSSPTPIPSTNEELIFEEKDLVRIPTDYLPKTKQDYEKEFEECVQKYGKEWVVMYVDTHFADSKYINHPDSVLRKALGTDRYLEYENYEPFCFECVHIYKKFKTAYPASVSLNSEIRKIKNDLESFSSQWYTAVDQMLHNYKVFDGDYWARASDRSKEFNTFMADINTLTQHIVLPCGEDTVKHLRFNTFYPSLRAIKGEWYDRSDLLVDLKRSTPHLNRFCAGWKRYIDTLTYHFPKHKAAELYHCRCIKRDTLLSKCQIDSLLEHPNNLDFTQ